MSLSDLIARLQTIKQANPDKAYWTFVQTFDSEERLQINSVYDVWVDDDGDVCIGKKDPD